jgi:UDP-GlcNAc:undecaprenyl-phosphate GlcNAc-1-phosphate transferase
MFQNLSYMIVSFCFTLLFLNVLEVLGQRIGLVDTPNARKLHTSPTPLVGGLAIFLTMVIMDDQFAIWNKDHQALMSTMTGVMLIGLADDFLGVKARTKLLTQCLAAFYVVLLGGMKVTYLGNLLGTGNILLPAPIQPLFTVIALVGTMNAINMIDGKDGLAAGIALMSSIGFVWLSILISDTYHLQTSLIFISAILAFLLLNFRFNPDKPARVFLGDAGCMMIAFFLATLSINLSQEVRTTVHPITCVWVIALPLMDMARVMVMRLFESKSPMAAGRDHLHHLLLDHGYPLRSAVLMMIALQAVFVGIALLAAYLHTPDYVLFYGFLVTLVGYCLVVTRLQRITINKSQVSY